MSDIYESHTCPECGQTTNDCASSQPRAQAADHIRQAILLLESTDPVPESAPGPEQTESGRNAQALDLLKAALPWLEERGDA